MAKGAAKAAAKAKGFKQLFKLGSSEQMTLWPGCRYK
jgi:hypothetical protein